MDEEDLLALIGYKANAIHTGSSRRLRSDCPQAENSLEKASGSGQEVLYRLSPLSARGVIAGDFAGPGTRQVDWRPDQKDESLPWVRCPNLLVEFERLLWGVTANVEHDEIVDMGLPEKSRSGDLFSFMHLDSATSQDGSARLAGCLAAVDEENSFPGKDRAATKWLAIHTIPPKRARPL
jgi:hypothetical protein